MPTKHKIYLKYKGNVHDVLIDPSLGLENALVAWDENWKTYPVPTPKAITRSLNQYFKNLNIDLSFDYSNQTTADPWSARDKKDIMYVKYRDIPATAPLTFKISLAGQEVSINASNVKDFLNRLKQMFTFDDEGYATLSINGVGYIFWIEYDADYFGGELAAFDEADISQEDWAQVTKFDFTVYLDGLWDVPLNSGLRHVLPFETIDLTLLCPDPEQFGTEVETGWGDLGDDDLGDDYVTSLKYSNGGFSCSARPYYRRLSKVIPGEDEGEFGKFIYFLSQLKVTGSSGVLEIPRTIPLNQPYPDQPMARQIAGDTVYYINDMFTHTVAVNFETERLTNLKTIQTLGG